MNVVHPTVDGWKHPDLLKDLLELIDEAARDGDFGPYVVVLGPGWWSILNQPYNPVPQEDEDLEAEVTVRGRILKFTHKITGVLVDHAAPLYAASVYQLSTASEPEDAEENP